MMKCGPVIRQNPFGKYKMKQNNELLSIIVPVYNVEKYLKKCVNSLIRQTYSQLQIILVDDGSTDSSGEICNQLAKEDDRIEVIHQSNGGLSRARNTGLQKVKGIYVAFIDSDDYIALNTYELVIHAMQKQEADVARFGWISVSESTVIPDKETNKSASILSLEDFFDGLETQRTRLVVWNAVYKREIIEGILFVPDIIYEDVSFTNQVLMRTNKEIIIDVPFYRYLSSREGNTITQPFIAHKRLPVLNDFESMYEKLIKKGVSLQCIQRYSRYCFGFGFSLYWLAYCRSADNDTMNTIFSFCCEFFNRIDFSKNKSGNDFKWKAFRIAPLVYCHIRKILRNGGI